jgi:hypothetical protein
VAILTRDAETAVRQAQMYAKNTTAFLPADLGQHSLFLGNSAYLFVIMGMGEELTQKLSNELYRESINGLLPRNLQLLPYDEVLRRFENGLVLQTLFLIPFPAEPRITTTISSLEEAVARGSGPALFKVTVGGPNPKSVVINYEYATRESAEDVQNFLTSNGYHRTWSYSAFDGEDEVWEPNE